MKKNKKITNKNKLIILLVLLLFIIGSLVFMLLKKDTNKENFMVINVSKIFDFNDWVYTMKFDSDIETASYTTESNKIYYLDDIKVPHINIDSEDAEEINNDINEVYNDMLSIYKMGLENKITYIDHCNYESNNINNVISVIIKYGKGGTDIVKNYYETYNISLEGGKKLSFEEVYKFLNYKSSSINKIVKKYITNKMEEELKNLEYPDGTDFNTYNNESYNNYLDSVKDNTIKYFIDKNKNLNVIVKLSIPAGMGSFDTIITITNN